MTDEVMAREREDHDALGNVALIPMQEHHLDQVFRIEQSTFNDSWSKAQFASEITGRHDSAYAVAIKDNHVVGYAGVAVVDGDAHINTIAVDAQYRKLGIGRQMMMWSLNAARALGAQQVSLEVRVSNTAAQALYRSFGFTQAGVRRRYYCDNSEDAAIMWLYNIDVVAAANTVRSEGKR